MTNATLCGLRAMPLVERWLSSDPPGRTTHISTRWFLFNACGNAMTAFVKVFGCRPSRTFPRARRPASENLQGTKPRGGARIGRCGALSYGDLRGTRDPNEREF